MSWLFVAGTVLTVAGTGATIAANEETNSAIHNARDEEARRQAALTQQRQKTFYASVNQSGADTARKDLTAGTSEREALYSQAGNAPQGAVATPALQQSNATVSGGQPSTGASDTSKAASNAWSNLVGGNQAKLGAYGDWTLNQGIKNNRASQDLALNANKSRGSLDVNKFEIEHATHAGDNLRDWGTVASALGSIGMMAGAGGGGTANSALKVKGPVLSGTEATTNPWGNASVLNAAATA